MTDYFRALKITILRLSKINYKTKKKSNIDTFQFFHHLVKINVDLMHRIKQIELM